MSVDLEMRVDALIVQFLEEGSTEGCSARYEKASTSVTSRCSPSRPYRSAYTICSVRTADKVGPMMAGTALHNLLHRKAKSKPRPITWIKLNRTRVYVHLVIPPCFKCGSPNAEIVWFNCQSGGCVAWGVGMIFARRVAEGAAVTSPRGSLWLMWTAQPEHENRVRIARANSREHNSHATFRGSSQIRLSMFGQELDRLHRYSGWTPTSRSIDRHSAFPKCRTPTRACQPGASRIGTPAIRLRA